VIRLDPTHLEARQAFGELALIMGEPEEAARQATAILAMRPKDVEAYLLQGQALERMGDPAGARAAFEEALSLQPDGVGPLWLLGSFHQRRGDPKVAESLLSKWTQVEPSFRSHTTLARFYQGVPDRDSDAEAALRAAIATASPAELVEAYRALANFYYSIGRAAESEKALQEGIDRNLEGALELRLTLSVFYQLEGDTEKAAEILEQATRDQPNELQTYLTLSELRGRNGDHDGALAAAESGLEADPSSVPAQLRKAEVLVDIGFVRDDQEAIAQSRALVEAVLASESSNTDARLVLGKVELVEGRVDEAVQLLEQLIQIEPQSAEAHSVLAMAFIEQRKLRRARAELVSALRIDPARFHLRRFLSRVAADLGENELALAQGRRYLRVRPDDIEVILVVVQSLVRLGRGNRARQRLEALTEEQHNALTLFTLGRLYFADMQLDDAWAHLMRASEMAPHHHDILGALLAVERARSGVITKSAERIRAAVAARPADAKLRQLEASVALFEGAVGRAEQGYQRAIQLDPHDFSAYDALAQLFVVTGRQGQAIATFEQALAEEPNSAALHHVLGVLYASDGQTKIATQHFEAAVRNAPDLAVPKNNLAYLYAERNENLDRALELARDAKTQLPDHPHAADTLGWVLHRLGIPTAAIAYLREAEAGIDPSGPEIVTVSHHLAQAYEANDQPDEALATLNRTIARIEQQHTAQSAAGRPESLSATAPLYEMRDRLVLAQVESRKD
jgi:tetratricopeptide (TPR) repeat protein